MRKSLMRRLTLAFCVLLLSAAGVGSLGAQTVSMQLVNANANYVMGGVYTSPYGISINGGSPTLLICDDFLTNISIGQTWTSQVTSLAALQAGTNPAGTPKFGNNVTNYATAAVLAAELMGLGNLATETAGELSYAIWGVFDPTLLTNNPSSGEGALTNAELTAAQNFLKDAKAVVAAATVGGVINLSKIPYLTIYTPDPLGASQEFLAVSMPEPASMVILGMDCLGMVGLALLLRRRARGN